MSTISNITQSAHYTTFRISELLTISHYTARVVCLHLFGVVQLFGVCTQHDHLHTRCTHDTIFHLDRSLPNMSHPQISKSCFLMKVSERGSCLSCDIQYFVRKHEKREIRETKDMLVGEMQTVYSEKEPSYFYTVPCQESCPVCVCLFCFSLQPFGYDMPNKFL